MTARLSMAIALFLVAGCGSMRSSPDAPQGAGGLVPTVEDKEVGLVGIAPGFDLKAYPVIGVALFPVTDQMDDEGDRRFGAEMSAYFQSEIVRRLRESGLFTRVVNLAETAFTPAPGEKVLRLEGSITRLGRGSQAARYFAGIFGAGQTRAQADMRFVETADGRAVMVVADRRIASIGLLGGGDRDHLRESFDDMARDLAKFLQRLVRGEAPRKE